MRARMFGAWLLTAWSLNAQSQTPPSAPTLFEGARLIVGDDTAPIEDSAFLVQDGRFVRVGRRGEVAAPAGTRRVDLSSKTVMPSLIELHAHVGYFETQTERRPSAASYTRAQLLEDMQKFAYYGVGAVLSLGADRREISYAVRDEWRASPPPNTARFFSAGPGLAAPDAGPAFELSLAVYSVTSEAEARADVRELAARGVDGWIKIWHDARRGKMPPPVIAAIIDEAHKHDLRVAAHIHELQDFKDLIAMGVDGLAHPTWRQESVDPVDDELIALFKSHPNLFMCTSFWTPRNQIYGAHPDWMDEPIVAESFSAAEVASLENAGTPANAAEQWANGRVPRAMKQLRDAGVRFGLGTDMGGGGPGYYGLSSHIELESMVKAGLTPAEAIVAGTRNSAEILGARDLGTIEAGKSADFLVLDANPLDDIANTRRISRVYLRGTEIDRAALRAEFAADADRASAGYEAVPDWAALPAGMEWESVTAASSDAEGNLFAFRRAQPPILELDAHGAFVRGLGEGIVSAAHGLRVDRDGAIFVADVRGHVVRKLTPDGQVLLTIGEPGVSGDDAGHFNGPTDVAIAPNGDLFVTDGQFNSRVVHFKSDGGFVKAWGTKGGGPGQFEIPHSIAMDSRGRLFVADRDNGRIQIFDQDGRFLEQWTQFGPPSGLFIAPDDTLYVAAIGEKSGLVVGSASDGVVRDYVPIAADGVNGPHLVSADANGAVYVADLLARDLKKFVKR